MKRAVGIVLALSMITTIVLTTGFARPGAAQSDATPTDGAAETAIADLQTRVAALETAAAAGTVEATTSATAAATVTAGSTVTAGATEPAGNVFGPGAISFPIVNGLTPLYIYARETTYGPVFYSEVLNTTEATAKAPQMLATLWDAQGNTLETVTLYSSVAFVAPGERVGYEGSSRQEMGAWAEISVELTGGEPASEAELAAEPTLVELDNLNVISDSGARLTVLGEVKNNESRTVSAVVRALFTGADGRYAGSLYRFGTFGYLAAGATGSFKIDDTITLEPGWTYRLVVDASAAYSEPPEIDQGIVEVEKETPFLGEPTVARTGTELISSYAQTRPFDGTNFFAELRNTSDLILDGPALYLTAYDDEDRVVESLTIYPTLTFMRPGETMPYTGSSSVPFDDWSRYVLSINASRETSESTIASRAEGLEIQDLTEKSRTETAITLAGEILNGGEQTVTYPYFLVLIYREDGRFAGSSWQFATPNELAPGESGTFSLLVNVDAGPNWTYKTLARGSVKT